MINKKMNYSPFEQFKISLIEMISPNIVISQSLLNVTVVTIGFITLTVFLLSMKKKKYDFSFFGYVCKQLYIFFYDVVSTYVGNHVNRFFPYMFYLFLFIALNNLVGLLPFAFTVTSHFVVTLGLSFTTWFGIFLLGLARWNLNYLELFFPKGLSLELVILLAALESISNVFRMFSLALRLLANMVAGHILLDCLTYLIYKTMTNAVSGSSISILAIILMIIPMIAFCGLLLFEVGVCILQAYIFVVLSCIYLKEVL
jgi:ATP synthase subunit 6